MICPTCHGRGLQDRLERREPDLLVVRYAIRCPKCKGVGFYYTELATRYGVNYTTIWRVIKNKNWKHL